MGNEIAAQEFLEYYLPSNFKEKLDLSKIKVEKESYIEESLRRKYSDIVYSVSTKNKETAFIYILLDHQSTVDYWMALRLWRYALLLCERHKKNKDKLPLIYPMIMYNGLEEYSAPRNIWELFTDPVQAKELMVSDYQLVDLQSMSDDEIVQQKHLGMMSYVMKHIHQRDMLKLWEEFLRRFKLEVLIDKENGYIYLESFFKCPQGHYLYPYDKLDKKQIKRYRTTGGYCKNCSLKSGCVSDNYSNRARFIYRNSYQDEVDEVKARQNRIDFKQKLIERKWKIEGLFGEAKENHGLRRTQFRGVQKTQIQIFMIAIVQNFKRILKIIFLFFDLLLLKIENITICVA